MKADRGRRKSRLLSAVKGWSCGIVTCEGIPETPLGGNQRRGIGSAMPSHYEWLFWVLLKPGRRQTILAF